MIKDTIVINRPIEAVFAYAAKFDRHPEWQDSLKAATLEGPPAVGVKGTESRQMGRSVQTYDWRISEFDPPNRIGFETLSGPMRPVGSTTFTAEGDATRLDFEMEMNPRGFMKLLSPMISRQVQRGVTADHVKLKELLESGTS